MPITIFLQNFIRIGIWTRTSSRFQASAILWIGWVLSLQSDRRPWKKLRFTNLISSFREFTFCFVLSRFSGFASFDLCWFRQNNFLFQTTFPPCKIAWFFYRWVKLGLIWYSIFIRSPNFLPYLAEWKDLSNAEYLFSFETLIELVMGDCT